MQFYSRAPRKEAGYLVSLPAGFAPTTSLPVFYLLHGIATTTAASARQAVVARNQCRWFAKQPRRHAPAPKRRARSHLCLCMGAELDGERANPCDFWIHEIGLT